MRVVCTICSPSRRSRGRVVPSVQLLLCFSVFFCASLLDVYSLPIGLLVPGAVCCVLASSVFAVANKP